MTFLKLKILDAPDSQIHNTVCCSEALQTLLKVVLCKLNLRSKHFLEELMSEETFYHHQMLCYNLVTMFSASLSNTFLKVTLFDTCFKMLSQLHC